LRNLTNMADTGYGLAGYEGLACAVIQQCFTDTIDDVGRRGAEGWAYFSESNPSLIFWADIAGLDVGKVCWRAQRAIRDAYVEAVLGGGDGIGRDGDRGT